MPTNHLPLLLALVTCASFGCAAQKTTTQGPAAPPLRISNDAPRTDVNGDTIDVHDGRVIRFGESYYWYGTAYGNTSGFTRANEYRVYSSPDMQTWTPHGAILPDAKSGIYYRPHVVYHAAAQEYVLWYNWYPKLWTGKFGVARSKSPTGPFRIVNDDVPVKHSGLGVGDFNLFVDEDRTAYLMYNTIEGHRLSVERLAADYVSSTMDNGGFIAEDCEAGSIFRRDGTYYLLTDYTCCFCTQGSGARVYTSASPLAGYALRQNINRQPGSAAPILTDGDRRPTQYQVLRRDTATGEFPAIELWFDGDQTLTSVSVLQYTGNRPGTCGDTINPRTHVPRTEARFGVSLHVGGEWQAAPGAFASERTTLTNAMATRLAAKPADAVRLTFDADYPYDVIQVVEISTDGATAKPDAYVIDLDERWSPPIVPAQQTFVMPLDIDGRTEYLWMGDLWGSAPDNVKGHDMQYWSPPLEFYENGLIRPLRWQGEWHR